MAATLDLPVTDDDVLDQLSSISEIPAGIGQDTSDVPSSESFDLVSQIPASIGQDTPDVPSSDNGLPPNLDGYDVLILYADKDEKDAYEYCQSLNKITLCNGRDVKAIMYTDQVFANYSATLIRIIDVGVKQCTFVFMYITTNFFNDDLMMLFEGGTLMHAIEKKKWSVIPIWAEKNDQIKTNVDIPMVVVGLLGLDFDKNGLDRHRRLVKEKIEHRLQAFDIKDKKRNEKRLKAEETINNGTSVTTLGAITDGNKITEQTGKKTKESTCLYLSIIISVIIIILSILSFLLYAKLLDLGTIQDYLVENVMNTSLKTIVETITSKLMEIFTS